MSDSKQQRKEELQQDLLNEIRETLRNESVYWMRIKRVIRSPWGRNETAPSSNRYIRLLTLNGVKKLLDREGYLYKQENGNCSHDSWVGCDKCYEYGDEDGSGIDYCPRTCCQNEQCSAGTWLRVYEHYGSDEDEED